MAWCEIRFSSWSLNLMSGRAPWGELVWPDGPGET